MQEKTFFMIKPDGVSRGLADEIIKRVQQSGLKITSRRKLSISKKLAQDLYSVHKGKPFCDGLIDFIMSGPVEAMTVEGEGAVLRIRDLMGATDPREALLGTIRGDLKEENILSPLGTMKNIVHGSDSPESAKRELALFFK